MLSKSKVTLLINQDSIPKKRIGAGDFVKWGLEKTGIAKVYHKFVKDCNGCEKRRKDFNRFTLWREK